MTRHERLSRDAGEARLDLPPGTLTREETQDALLAFMCDPNRPLPSPAPHDEPAWRDLWRSYGDPDGPRWPSPVTVAAFAAAACVAGSCALWRALRLRWLAVDEDKRAGTVLLLVALILAVAGGMERKGPPRAQPLWQPDARGSAFEAAR